MTGARAESKDGAAVARRAAAPTSDDPTAAAGAAKPPLATHHIHLLSVLGFGVLWVLLAQTLPAEILPGPLPVLGALWESVASGDLFFHMYRTLVRVFLAFGLAMLVGVPIGVAMGLNRRVEAASVIWVMVLLTVPGLVYLILMFMWFGLNEVSTILAITVTGLPSIVIVIWEGVKNIDNKLTAMARAFGVPHRRRVSGVLLPQLMPYLFSATRFGLGVMWKITVFAELIGRSDGVGFKLNYWYQLYNMKQVLAWTLAFTMVMIVIELGLIRQLEKRLFAWRPAAKL